MRYLELALLRIRRRFVDGFQAHQQLTENLNLGLVVTRTLLLIGDFTAISNERVVSVDRRLLPDNSPSKLPR